MENISFECNQLMENPGIKLNEMRHQNLFCDWSIRCADDGAIKQVHKNILISRCPYFEDMLKDGNMAECFSNTLQVSDISGEEFEMILTFIYTGTVKILNENEKSDITTKCIEKIQRIFLHARYFKLSYLQLFCLNLLEKLTNGNFCLNMWKFGVNKCCLPLEKYAFNFILRKASNLYKNSNFISALNENQIKIILESQHLKAKEEDTFEFAFKWIELQSADDTKKMANLIEDIMPKVRFGLIEDKYLYSKILSNEIIRKNPNISKVILDSLYSKWNFENRTKMIFSPSTTLRIKPEYKDQLVVFRISETNRSYYNTSEGLSEWLNLPFTCCSSKGQACVKFQNYVLFCGGTNTNGCALFSGYAKDLINFPSMLEDRCNHSAAFFDFKIYACGGENSTSTEYFDLMNGSWEVGTKMNTLRSHFSLSAVNGALYALGGEYNSSVEIFDPRKQGENGRSWDLITNAATANSYKIISSAVIHNSIYCFNDNEYYEFDTRMNSSLESRSYCWEKADLCCVCEQYNIETGRNEILVVREDYEEGMRADFFDVKKNALIHEYDVAWLDFPGNDTIHMQFLYLP